VTILTSRPARLALLATVALTLAGPAGAQRRSGRAAAPAGRERPVQIHDVKRTRLTEAVRITIELEREVSYRSERLDGPPRLVFDFLGTRPAATLVQGSLSYPDDVVRHIRVGRHPNNVTRVVLDLTGVQRYLVFALYDPYRLVIDCVRTGQPAVTAAARPPASPPAGSKPAVREPGPAAPEPRPALPAVASAPLPPERVTDHELAAADVEPSTGPVLMFSRRLRVAFVPIAAAPVPSPIELETEAPPAAAAPAAAAPAPATPSSAPPPSAPPSSAPPPPAPAPKPSAPATASSGEKPVTPAPLKGGFSLARQLGLGATRIVIDPGHGGRDPGAQARGISEAAITLDIALRLEKLLKGAGIDVVLTRRTDRYVALEERTEIANRAAGDLFLSIHANASRNTRAQGVESYVLNFASNPEAEAVAARENASSERTMSSLNTILQAIALNNKLDESRGFAASVQNALVRRLRATRRQLKDLGVKQAPFVVLIGAEMPSVLVEVSFISHQQEGRLLRTATYRQRVAEALFEGIRGYQKSLKRALEVSRED